jgi:hypothetical protein
MAFSIADLCQRHDVSVEQLIEQSGLPEDRVKAIVLGRWTPSPEERRRVAGVFGAAVEDIAWGHQTPVQKLYGQGPT